MSWRIATSGWRNRKLTANRSTRPTNAGKNAGRATVNSGRAPTRMPTTGGRLRRQGANRVNVGGPSGDQLAGTLHVVLGVWDEHRAGESGRGAEGDDHPQDEGPLVVLLVLLHLADHGPGWGGLGGHRRGPPCLLNPGAGPPPAVHIG